MTSGRIIEVSQQIAGQRRDGPKGHTSLRKDRFRRHNNCETACAYFFGSATRTLQLFAFSGTAELAATNQCCAAALRDRTSVYKLRSNISCAVAIFALNSPRKVCQHPLRHYLRNRGTNRVDWRQQTTVASSLRCCPPLCVATIFSQAV